MVKTFKKRRSSTALAKRVKVLETKQKADDKNTERKVQYYRSPHTLSNSWGANYGFALRTLQGTAGEGNTTAGETRIGNSVNLRSMAFKFRLDLFRNVDGVVGQPNSATVCRVILADNLTDDTGLTASDVLQDTNYAITSPYKNAVAGGKRYRILMDKKIKLQGSNRPDVVWDYKMPIPKSGRVVHYGISTPSSPLQNPSDMNISLIYYCTDISPTSGNKPVLYMYNIARFEDC